MMNMYIRVMYFPMGNCTALKLTNHKNGQGFCRKVINGVGISKRCLCLTNPEKSSMPTVYLFFVCV